MTELSNEELINLVEDLRGESEYREEYQQEFRGRVPIHQPKEISIYSPTPLARLLSKERTIEMRKNLKTLEPLIRAGLNPQQDGFLRLLVGGDWWENLSLPSLEFVDDVEAYAQQILPEIKERIDLLIYSMHNFSRVKSKALHLISNPYFLLTENETISVYKGVLANGHTFSAGFFEGDNGRKAGIITRYMYEQLVGYCHEEVFLRARKMDFKNHSLGYMLQTQFNDSVQDAVQNAYSKLRCSDLQVSNENTNGKPRNLGALSDLVDSLDALFRQEGE